jgi:DNA-binding response OmpR family regulator
VQGSDFIMASSVLYVGRQPDIYAPLWHHLETHQVDVLFAASQSRALRTLARGQADVVVLDATSLPLSAEDLTRLLRQQAPWARIVLVASADTLATLSYDYLLVDPVKWGRLLQVIEEALLREKRQVLATGPFVLDLVEQTIVGPAGESRLTPKQFHLLELLMRHAEKLVPRKQIMQEVWNTTYLDDTRTLDVHISWLRRAIEPDPRNPRFLRTKRGVGYIFYPNGQGYFENDEAPSARDNGNAAPEARLSSSPGDWLPS